MSPNFHISNQLYCTYTGTLQIHVMRDNPNHSAPLMGGMWGARLNTTQLRMRFTSAFKQILKDGMAYIARGNGGWDQMALRR